MKRILVVLSVLFLVIPSYALADDEGNEKKDGYKISHITVSSGDDPISSGLTGIIAFVNESNNRVFEVGLQQEQAWLIHGRKFHLGEKVDGLVAGTIGHFQGAPWVGPLLRMEMPTGKFLGQDTALSMFHWPGLMFWEPRDWKNDGVENPERFNKGYVGGVQFNIGPIGLAYAWQNFLDDPWNELPGISCTFNIRDDVTTTGSATWNNNSESWMFYIGATWKKS